MSLQEVLQPLIPVGDPDQVKNRATAKAVAEALARESPASKTGAQALRLGEEVVDTIAGMELGAVPEEDAVQADWFARAVSIRSFLVNLHGEPEWYRQRLARELNFSSGIIDSCVDNFLLPELSQFFRRVIQRKKDMQTRNSPGREVPIGDAISSFVDDEYFVASLETFCLSFNLRRVDQDFAAKVFYKVFQQHFDSRQGAGVIEMITVGEKHPDELEKMRLMEEYEDIRAALLRLQLTGKVKSPNYR